MKKEDYLLVEDDCAPDAREYFKKKLLASFGLTIEDFKEKGVKISTRDDECIYSYNGYILESFAHDEGWHLRIEKKQLYLDIKTQSFIKLTNAVGIVHAKEGGILDLDSILIDFVKFIENEDWDKENLNLCDSCSYHPAACEAEDIKHGTGKGNDNIYSCSKYEFKK